MCESESLTTDEDDTVEIELASQFYTWLGSLNNSETGEEGEEQNKLLEHLATQHTYCSTIIERTNDILFKLAELKEKYQSVSQKTSSLHETCESLLQTQTNLSQKASEIEDNLKFFNLLPGIEAVGFSFTNLP